MSAAEAGDTRQLLILLDQGSVSRFTSSTGISTAISRRVLLVVSVGLTFAFQTLTVKPFLFGTDSVDGMGYNSSVKTRGEKRQTERAENKVTNVTSGS